MTEMESNPEMNQNEQLSLCLKNLFQGPSQGIENAFALILKLLEKQQQENRELQLAHVELDKQSKALFEKLKGQFEEKHENLQTKFEKDNEQLKESVEVLKKERDDLLKITENVNGKQSIFEKLLEDMKGEVKVSLFSTLSLIQGKNTVDANESKFLLFK